MVDARAEGQPVKPITPEEQDIIRRRTKWAENIRRSEDGDECLHPDQRMVWCPPAFLLEAVGLSS